MRLAETLSGASVDLSSFCDARISAPNGASTKGVSPRSHRDWSGGMGASSRE